LFKTKLDKLPINLAFAVMVLLSERQVNIHNFQMDFLDYLGAREQLNDADRISFLIGKVAEKRHCNLNKNTKGNLI